MFESLGPHFFSRISREEGSKSGGDDADATPLDIYFIELSATGLSMNDIIFVESKVCTDPGTTAFLNTNNLESELLQVGSATVAVTEMRFQHSDDNFKGCTIVRLDVTTGDTLTDMEAFAAIVRRIQAFCIGNHVEHLAMVEIKGSCWSSGLLKHAGLSLCDCELLYKNVLIGFQLCMTLPHRPTDPPVSRLEDLRVDSSVVQERDDLAATAKSTQPAAKISAKEGPTPKKEWCMHWIMRGECAYMQTGCKYKHEMPTDMETRLRIGVREIPPWFIGSSHWRPFLQRVDLSECARLIGSGRKRLHLEPSHPANVQIEGALMTAHTKEGLRRRRVILLSLVHIPCSPYSRNFINLISHPTLKQGVLAQKSTAPMPPTQQ